MSDPIGSSDTEKRFAFGRNWQNFLTHVDETRIVQAESSIKDLLEVDNLNGMTFLDIGSGSGLFSLAAQRLGAQVHSFDFDPLSVACTTELKHRYAPNDSTWTIEQGSVLDREYMKSLGEFDLVYSWGVLHHTGSMWEAIDNALLAVKPLGKATIAIYNDPQSRIDYWTRVKKIYNDMPIMRLPLIAIHMPVMFLSRWLARAITGRLVKARGMSLWHDFLDWLGGYPYENAKPEEVFNYCRDRGFALVGLRTCGGSTGNNQFVIERKKD